MSAKEANSFSLRSSVPSSPDRRATTLKPRMSQASLTPHRATLTFHRMFIRKTATRNNATNEPYFTFRLVASERTAQQVRQITLLNLGRHFDLPQPDWPRLCARLDALLAGQTGMLAEPDAVETLAQRFAARLIAAQMHPTPSAAVPKPPPAPEPAQPAPSAASTAPDASTTVPVSEP